MTSAIIASLTRLPADLDQIGARWALVGGFAVSAWAEPRFTQDVDVCLAVEDDDQAEGVALTLAHRGYVVSSVVEHEVHHQLATIRLVSPLPGGVLVDLLFASSGRVSS